MRINFYFYFNSNVILDFRRIKANCGEVCIKWFLMLLSSLLIFKTIKKSTCLLKKIEERCITCIWLTKNIKKGKQTKYAATLSIFFFF